MVILHRLLKEGQARGVNEVANNLFQQSQNNTAAAIFYLKNRAPDLWQDRRVEELQGGNVTLNLNTGINKDEET